MAPPSLVRSRWRIRSWVQDPLGLEKLKLLEWMQRFGENASLFCTMLCCPYIQKGLLPKRQLMCFILNLVTKKFHYFYQKKKGRKKKKKNSCVHELQPNWLFSMTWLTYPKKEKKKRPGELGLFLSEKTNIIA